jgi:S1-C subfamily serine protease
MKKLYIIIGIIIIICFGLFYIARLYKTNKLTQDIKIQEMNTLLKETQSQLNDIKNKPPEVKTEIKTIYQTTKSDDDTTKITKEWSTQVVYLECHWPSKNGKFEIGFTGSGTLMTFGDGSTGVITNKHVLGIFSQCDVYLLNGEKYTSDKNNGDWDEDPNLDLAILAIHGMSQNTLNIAGRRTDYFCHMPAEIGDKVTILGYPGIGGSGITVTEGIISGNDGDYYVTSAKIDHGNSGGLAVLDKNNCMIGIPTASVSGSIESLGRILSNNVLWHN